MFGRRTTHKFRELELTNLSEQIETILFNKIEMDRLDRQYKIRIDRFDWFVVLYKKSFKIKIIISI
jgi:hypothetical protein